ncbi:hypothetical protein VTN77DRAFT_7329 [Rasamsonia byssochlamydoides]|uniref:uncharacterized protein n=1 Tax=Rasamsonia byssochlamydoides TaxID=89139 RepID=UPI003743BB75
MAISVADSSSRSPSRHCFSSVFPEPKKAPPKQSMWQRLGLLRWLHRDHSPRSSSPNNKPQPNKPQPSKPQPSKPQPNKLTRRLSRKVGVGLPRAPTFRRQISERRDRLVPADPEPRRAVSADLRTLSNQRTTSPPPAAIAARLSAPEVQSWRGDTSLGTLPTEDDVAHENLQGQETLNLSHQSSADTDPAGDLSHWESGPYLNDSCDQTEDVEDVEDLLEWELEKKWILNLSMHFRDKSEREKFFVTYAETPNRWRRVTISCDYRNAPPDSLEQDLKELHYQRDKSARIYESIRESLPEIQFYDTVTNLKLETSDGRLHVHVTEDVNEIIPYPPISSVRHLEARLIPEYQLHFDAHLSGFVYRVLLDGKAYIKKEIPGPDTVDEFLYEINALHTLSGASSVIQFEGIIVDDYEERIKGLLISYAEKGALVDILYDYRGQLPWARRERWAKQIVQGLCEIHEAGYVQGDFTLSNIVIDADDNAKIIDINRRGCPVGWEPPEIAAKIESNQRISMYIGVKSDLFQLGITLWALAMQEDEPECQSRPLVLPADAKVPAYYRELVSHCLSPRPQDRLSAKELLAMFPSDLSEEAPNSAILPPWSSQGPPSDRTTASATRDQSICLEDHPHANTVYVPPGSTLGVSRDKHPSRGRQPPTHAPNLSEYYQPSSYLASSASPHPDRRRSISQSDFECQVISPDPGQEPRFEEIEINGTPYLVHADAFTTEEFQAMRDQGHQPHHHSQGLQSAQGSGLSRVVVPSSTGDVGKETEVDLDASLDPRYRESTEPFQIGALSGDLAGVGGHPSCSLEQEKETGQDSRPSRMPTQTTAVNLNQPAEIQLSLSISTAQSEVQRGLTSLLDSQLPINPALQTQTQTPPKPEQPPGPPSRTSFLLDSRLPINPACSAIFFDSPHPPASLSARLSI